MNSSTPAANKNGSSRLYASAAGANIGVAVSTAIQRLASTRRSAPAINAERPAVAITGKKLPAERGVARQTYHAERQAKAYTSDNGSSSASASGQVSPSRVATAASRMPMISQAAR